MHNKSFTVDNQATILGGRNIGNEYFDANPDLAFADLDVLLIGPLAEEVSSVKCLRGQFWITTSDTSPATVQQLLEDWYREHTRTIFKARLDECHRLAVRKGMPEPKLRIQKMMSRWGRRSDKGRILLNLELIKAPKDCIDYVISHKLCHLKEKHHGPKFWNLLEKLRPDYEQRRKKLNQFADI